MLPPYAQKLGVLLAGDEAEPTLLRLPAGAQVLGRPGFMHGGAIAGLLEIAAMVRLYAEFGEDRPLLKPISVTVDFMRGGRLIDTWAAGRIVRLGGRIANLEAEAWQDDRSRPIAAGRMNLLIDRDA